MHKLVARLKTRDWIAPPVCASKMRLLGSSLRRRRGCRGRSGRGMGRHDHRLKPAPWRALVVVVVVVAGEAAAWAGTITDLTTGLTQRSGKTSGLNEPPPSAICRMRRRSTVMVEDPPLARSVRRPQNIRKISDCTVPLKRITIRPAGIEGQCEDQHSAGGPGSRSARRCLAQIRRLASRLPAATRCGTGSPP